MLLQHQFNLFPTYKLLYKYPKDEIKEYTVNWSVKENETYLISYTRESRKYAYSLEVQDRKIVQYSERIGLKIKYKFRERRSAFGGSKRPAFARAIEALQDPLCKGILFAKVDRSLRNIPDMSKLDALINKKKIIFINGEFDLQTAIGRKSFRNACVDACHYSEDLSEKITDSQIEMLEDGKYPYGMPVYLSRVNGTLTRNKYTPIAERILDMYVTGMYSDKTLAKRLNTLGYRQPKGKRFTKKSVTQIVSNPLFSGQYIDKSGKSYKLNSERIKSRSFWNQLQQIRDNRNRRGGIKHNYTYSKLIAYAPNKYLCGEVSKGHVYYKSVGQANFFFTSPETQKKVRQIKEEDIDHMINFHLQNKKINAVFIRGLRDFYEKWGGNRNKELKERTCELQQQLEGVREKTGEAPLLYMDGKISSEILKKVLEKLETQEKELLSDLSQVNTFDKDFFEITESIIKLNQLAHSNFNKLPPEIKLPLYNLFIAKTSVVSGLLEFEPTPYLEELSLLAEKTSFEPSENESQSSDSTALNPKMDSGGEEGTLFEQLNSIYKLYEKYQVKEKVKLLQRLMKDEEISIN